MANRKRRLGVVGQGPDVIGRLRGWVKDEGQIRPGGGGESIELGKEVDGY